MREENLVVLQLAGAYEVNEHNDDATDGGIR